MRAERAPGTSLKSTEMTFRRIEDMIHDTIPELKNQNTDLGVGETFGAFAKGSYAGKIRISLIDKEKRKRTQMEIEGALREKFRTDTGLLPFSITQGNFSWRRRGSHHLCLWGRSRLQHEFYPIR